MSADPFPAIIESEATGRVAEIFDDIRQVMGMPVINLVWRHFALNPDGLAWAWRTLRPHYESGAVEAEAAALVKEIEVETLPVMPQALLRSSGIDAEAERSLRVVLDTYDRGNAMNLVALATLFVDPETPPAPPGDPSARLQTVAGPAPTIPAMDGIPEDILPLVRSINTFGAGEHDHIMASIYRQFAHWPGYLSLSWMALAPMAQDGRLDAMIESTHRKGLARAARLVGSVEPAPASENTPVIREAAALFARYVIARLIPITAMLRRAMPAP